MSEIVLCRLCGSERNEQEMVSKLSSIEEENLNLKDKIFYYCRIQLSSDEKLPQSVCRLCRLQLETFVAFCENIRDVEEKFGAGSLKVEVKTEIKPIVKKELKNEQKPEPLERRPMRESSMLQKVADLYKDHLSRHVFDLPMFSHITVDQEYVSEEGEISQEWLKKFSIKTWNNFEFICQHCQEKFMSLDALLVHMRSAKADRAKVACPGCRKQFANINAYLNHTIKTHSMDHLAYTCVQCCKIFYNIASLFNHYRSQHSFIKNILPCIECGYYANSFQSLTVHVLSHSAHEVSDGEEIDDHKAPETSGSSQSSATKAQKRTRSSNEPSTSKSEPTEDSNPKSLIDKAPTEKKRKIFPCNKCDSVHLTHRGMLYHKLVHSGEKPYKCAKCPRSFRAKQDCDNHYVICRLT